MTATLGAERDARAGGRIPWQAKYLTLALIWGSSFLLMKVGLESLHPIQIAALRLITGAATIIVLLRITGGRLPTGRRTWAHLLVTGLLLAALPFTLFAASETRIPSALAGIGNATTPIVTVVATLVMLPGQRATRAKVVAILIGFVGVVTIMQPWQAQGRPDVLGFAMALVGGACYGIGWTYNRRYLAGVDLGGFAQPAATLLSGLVWMVPVVVAWGLRSPGGLTSVLAYAPPDAGTWRWLPLVSVLALGIVGTGLAYVLQFDVVRAAGQVVAATVTYLIPIVSVLLGVLVLGERLGPAQIAGFLIVLAAAWVVNRRGRG